MKPRPRPPAVPRPAAETLRHAIGELLRDGPLSAREISVRAHLTVRDVTPTSSTCATACTPAARSWR